MGTAFLVQKNFKALVTDGLILHLDASNSSSYSGSGTTWFDLSGSSNHTTLRSPNFSTANGGIFNFTGSSNQFFTPPTNFFNHNGGTPFTASFWFKANAPGLIFGQQNTSTEGTLNGWVPAIYVDSSNKLRTSLFWGGSTTNQSVSPGTTLNQWFNVTVTYNNPNHISYLNGSSYATISKTQNNYGPTYYYYFGAGAVNSWTSEPSNRFLNGSLGAIYFYNRTLTAAEVQQNFEATRARFGV
jgi:hypothetical protein